MAVVGEVASIAGLVSLAGQAIQAASSLYSFIKAYKTIHPKIQELATTLHALQTCLSDVRRMALHADSVHGHYHPEIAEIFSSVRSCYELFDQIGTRLDSIRTCVGRNVGKKLKIAAQDDYFPSIYRQLSTHHERLSVLLNTATWYTSLETLAGVRELSNTAAEIKNAQLQSRRQIRTQRAASENLLAQKVDAISQVFSSGATQNQLTAIEARLILLQSQYQQLVNAAPSDLQNSKSFQNLPTSSPLSPTAADSPMGSISLAGQETTESLVKLVDTSLVLRVRHGRLTYSLEPVKDGAFTALSMPRKKAMVRHLQCLRLLLWLLRKENYMTIVSCKAPQSPRSRLGRDAAVHSLAAFCTSYTALDLALGQRSLELASALPWLRWKPWLQYLFDRVDDRTEDREQIMSMIVQQWERMPRPEDGYPGYYLTIPQTPIGTPGPFPPVPKIYDCGRPVVVEESKKRSYCTCRRVRPYFSAKLSRVDFRCVICAFKDSLKKRSSESHLSELPLTQEHIMEGLCDLCYREIGQEQVWVCWICEPIYCNQQSMQSEKERLLP